MKIVQIGSYPLDSTCIKGGVEASVYGISKSLSNLQNDVWVIDLPRVSIKSDVSEKDGLLTIFRFSAQRASNYSGLSRVFAIVSQIRRIKPTVCHIHTTSLLSLIIYLFLKFYGFPTLLTVHGLAHVEKQKAWSKKKSLPNLVKLVLHSLSEFIFLSICPIIIVDTQYVLNAINLYKTQRKILKVPLCRVIPQGINPIFFDLDISDAKSVTLLSVGALNERKGHSQLIEAIKEIVVTHPEITVVIAGSNSGSIYYRNLLSKIRDNRLERNIKIIPNVPIDEIIELYRKATIFVLHSEEESQGIVLCEAMAVGMPVVATNVGGIPWVINQGENGLLSKFGDIETFSKNIVCLVNNVELQNKIKLNNQLEAQKYKWSKIAEEIESLYQSVI